MGRSPGYSKEGLNRGAWTNQEDKILSEYIRIHGDGGWGNLPQKAGLNRRGKSCRLRWLNYLRPEIKRGNISMDEEELIIRLHRLLGNRWSLIAGRLPGRTDNEIKNYWNTHLSKKLQSMNESQPKTSTQNFKNGSKCPSPALENQVLKTTPLQRTIAMRHSGSVRPCGRSNCSSGQGSKLCDLKETASFSKSLSDHRFLKGSVTHDDPVSTAFAAADVNLLEIAEAGNSICYMSSSHYFASDAATLAEGLLDLNYLSAPDCNLMLSSPSDCLTAIGLEELYREPAPIFAAEMNPLEEICFDEGNMQRVKSFTMADDQDLEEFYNINPDCADWIHELSLCTKI